MECSAFIKNIKIELDSEICCKTEDFFHYDIKNKDGVKCEVKTEGENNEDACSKSAVDSDFSEIPSSKKNRNKNHRLKTKPPVLSETSIASSLISKNFGEAPSTSSTPYSLRAHKRKYTTDMKEEKCTELELSIGTHPKNDDIKDDLKQPLNLHKDSPSYRNLKNSGFKFYHRHNPNAIVFTEEEARALVADCVGKVPKYADLPKEPGSKYVDKFIQVMPNLCSSESDEEEFKETATKKIKKRVKKKAVGYNGKPLPDSCLIDNYEWLFQDEKFIKKNQNPILKTPVAERLSSYVEAGEEITKEVVAELEAMVDRQVSATATSTVLSVHQVSTATTKVLLPAD